jgi:hypothetical protein
MKLLALIVCIAALSGCSSLQIDHVLSNLDRDCQRHYTGSFGGTFVGTTVAFDINCLPSGTTTTTTVTSPPAKPVAVEPISLVP